MQQGNKKAIIAALAANAGIAIAKFVGFAVTGAASLLAEGVHSVADSGNQALLLWGGSAAKRPANEAHPFGYGQERYFWAFVVALVIFSLGSLFATYEGIQKLLHPHDLVKPGWAIGILLLGLLLEGYSLHTAIVEARRVKGERSWWSFIRKTKNPELPVVLLEDLGAMFGLAIALIGVTVAMLTGDARFDAMGSIAIGLLLGAIAVVLAVEMKSLLIGEAASAEDQARIRERVTTVESVRRIIHQRTLHLGPDELLVAMKVDFDPSLSVEALGRAIDAVEREVRSALPIATLIYVEPDIYVAAEDTRLADQDSTGDAESSRS